MLPSVPDLFEIDRVRQILNDTTNPDRIADAWRILAASGDSYADNAAAVTTSHPRNSEEWAFQN